MRDGDGATRRGFLKAAAVSGIGLYGCGPRLAPEAASDLPPGTGAAEVTPAEDLMREHGVLRRVLLIYDETLRRMSAGEPVPDGVVGDAATVVRRFIEEYHEKLEEQFLFPLFENAGKLVELVAVLRQQHAAGREATDAILEAVAGGAGQLADAEVPMREFIRMYRPHAAREDTVLFPALRPLLTDFDYRQLGERFEDHERETLGEAGFAGTVQKIEELEQSLEIYDLAGFTPSRDEE
jgi:hemerythrin-like domain-containing protein